MMKKMTFFAALVVVFAFVFPAAPWGGARVYAEKCGTDENGYNWGDCNDPTQCCGQDNFCINCGSLPITPRTPPPSGSPSTSGSSSPSSVAPGGNPGTLPPRTASPAPGNICTGEVDRCVIDSAAYARCAAIDPPPGQNPPGCTWRTAPYCYCRDSCYLEDCGNSRCIDNVIMCDTWWSCPQQSSSHSSSSSPPPSSFSSSSSGGGGPTPTPRVRVCGDSCRRDSQCDATGFCYFGGRGGSNRGICRNRDCPEEADCACPPGPTPNLNIEKTAPGYIGADNLLSYTVTVTNSGGAPLPAGEDVRDTLPVSTEYVSSDPDICTPQSGSRAILCTMPQIDAGGKYTFDVTVRVLPGLDPDTALLNTACVDNPATQRPECDHVEVFPPHLVIDKTTPGEVGDGQLLVYTITVTNTGRGGADGFSVTESLPLSSTYVTSSPQICTPSAEGELVCASDQVINPGGSFTFTVTVRVNPGLPPGTVLENTACVENPLTDNPDCDTEPTPVNVKPVCGSGTLGDSITNPHIIRVNLDQRRACVTGLATDPENDFLHFSNWALDPAFGDLDQSFNQNCFGSGPPGFQVVTYQTPAGDDWLDQLPRTVNIAFDVTDEFHPDEPVSCSGEVVIVNANEALCSCLDDDSCVADTIGTSACGQDGCAVCQKRVAQVLRDPATGEICQEFPADCAIRDDCPVCDPGTFSDAWFQAVGGDVHSNYMSGLGSSLRCNIPEGTERPYFSLTSEEAGGSTGVECEECGEMAGDESTPGPGTNLSPGIVSGSLAPLNFGGGEVSTTGWRVDSYNRQLYSGVGAARRYDFDFFYDRYGDPTEAVLDDHPSGNLGGGVWIHDGDLTISDDLSVKAPEQAVVFVKGDLKINLESSEAITVEPGAFLAFIVQGSVIISSDVAGTVDTPAVQGVFVASRQIVTESKGDGLDERLFAAGSFTAYGGFDLNRDLDDNTLPAETFLYRPDLAINSPGEIKLRRVDYNPNSR